jgi:hypothetical protein
MLTRHYVPLSKRLMMRAHTTIESLPMARGVAALPQTARALHSNELVRMRLRAVICTAGF